MEILLILYSLCITYFFANFAIQIFTVISILFTIFGCYLMFSSLSEHTQLVERLVELGTLDSSAAVLKYEWQTFIDFISPFLNPYLNFIINIYSDFLKPFLIPITSFFLIIWILTSISLVKIQNGNINDLLSYSFFYIYSIFMALFSTSIMGYIIYLIYSIPHAISSNYGNIY